MGQHRITAKYVNVRRNTVQKFMVIPCMFGILHTYITCIFDILLTVMENLEVP